MVNITVTFTRFNISHFILRKQTENLQSAVSVCVGGHKNSVCARVCGCVRITDRV